MFPNAFWVLWKTLITHININNLYKDVYETFNSEEYQK